jgi:diaminopimelate epimerase
MASLSFFFQKYHGNGNDFIFLDKDVFDSFATLFELRQFILKICHRNFGAGADGVVFCDRFTNRILIFNSDGSLAATCGNALRCYGLKLLQEKRWDGCSLVFVKRLVPVLIERHSLEPSEIFARDSTESFATLVEGNADSKQVCVGMGRESQVKVLALPERKDDCVFVQLSNPHLVFVSSLFCSFKEEQYKQFGQWAQGEFLNTISVQIPLSNISMVSLSETQPASWSLVVYERGAGLTLCCGSGAVASRVALEVLDLVKLSEDKISFNLPGGFVDVSSRNIQGTNQRALSGSAEMVFSGNFLFCL